jgi:hypothetical protein
LDNPAAAGETRSPGKKTDCYFRPKSPRARGTHGLDQGYIRSEKGHGGGWTLGCDLSEVTWRDIYTVLGCPSLLAIGNRTESPGCFVEEAVNAALNQAFQHTEALLLSRLGEVTLAMLSADFHNRLVARGGYPRSNLLCP